MNPPHGASLTKPWSFEDLNPSPIIFPSFTIYLPLIFLLKNAVREYGNIEL
jgi:hypothetical protein